MGAECWRRVAEPFDRAGLPRGREGGLGQRRGYGQLRHNTERVCTLQYMLSVVVRFRHCHDTSVKGAPARLAILFSFNIFFISSS